MIAYKIFDKTFPHSTNIYGIERFKNTEHCESVQQNHRAIMQDMGADNMLIINHVFSTEIIDADRVTDFSLEPNADAAVTTLPGVLLTLQTADCVPIMLISDDDKVIGAAHCSWHTAKNNILEKLVDLMQQKDAKNIRAIIGPAIHQESYEVDQAFYTDFLESDQNADSFFIPSKNQGRFMFDLPGFCLSKLKQKNVTNITDLCEDTYTHPAKYCSYRRDTHLGIKGRKENILSTIMIKS